MKIFKAVTEVVLGYVCIFMAGGCADQCWESHMDFTANERGEKSMNSEAHNFGWKVVYAIGTVTWTIMGLKLLLKDS